MPKFTRGIHPSTMIVAPATASAAGRMAWFRLTRMFPKTKTNKKETN